LIMSSLTKISIYCLRWCEYLTVLVAFNVWFQYFRHSKVPVTDNLCNFLVSFIVVFPAWFATSESSKFNQP
jgi:hypothetical protein